MEYFATQYIWQQSVDKQPKRELSTLRSKDSQKHSNVKAKFIMILPALMEQETEVISFTILFGTIASNWIILRQKSIIIENQNYLQQLVVIANHYHIKLCMNRDINGLPTLGPLEQSWRTPCSSKLGRTSLVYEKINKEL